MSDDYQPGERVLWIVGWPGPDVDEAEIVRKNDDGTYRIRFQVYGQGDWHEDNTRPDDMPGHIGRIVGRVR